MQIKDKNFKLYLSETTISNRVKQLAAEISNDLSGQNPLFITVLTGAMIFASDLYRNITIQSELTSIRLKSYVGTESTGKVKTVTPLYEKVSDRTVVIVEDIIDSGITIQNIIQQIKSLGAKNIFVVALLFKEEACKIKKPPIDYYGFKIPNKFVVGYGLDYDEQGRNLRDIYEIAGD